MAPNIFADARRALAWSAIAKWLDVGGSALTFLVMVTLLGPQTFGLYGMALVVVALPEAAVGALSENIIQRKELRPGHIAATLWLELALAALLFGGLMLLTPHTIGVFDNHQELHILIPVMAATLFLLAIGSVPAALLQRKLQFKAIAAVDAIGSVSAAIVGLTLAILGFDVWSLLWMEVARRTIRALGFAIAARWRPAFVMTLKDARELTRFNLMTLAQRMAVEADNAIPRFFVGAMLGATALGYFNLAQRIFFQAASIIIAPFWAVALPVAAKARDDHHALRVTLDSATRLTSLVAFPVFLGAAAVAPVAIPLLLGESWGPAVPVIQIVLLNGIRAGAAPLTIGVLRGAGAPGLSLAISVGSVLIGAILTPIVAQWGLSIVALVLFGRTVWAWLAGAAAMKRTVDYPIWPQLFLGWRSLLAAILMAGGVLLAQQLAYSPHSILGLTGLVILGGAIYVAVLSVLSPALVRRLTIAILSLFRGERVQLSTLLDPVPGTRGG